MIYRTSVRDVADYYNSENINQSSLVTILQDGIQEYIHKKQVLQRNEKDYGEKEYFVIGSAVDIFITMGKDVFVEQFFVSDLQKKPSVQVMTIIKMIFDEVIRSFPAGSIGELTDFREQIYSACNEVEYYKNRVADTWQQDTRYTTILKANGEAYWQDLILADGKQVLSDNEAQRMDCVIQSFLSHRHTANLFVDREDKDIVYQCPMYFSYEGIECKALPDMIILDHKKKRIKPIDIKTMGEHVLLFNRSVRKRRYDIQGSFYNTAVGANVDLLSELTGKDLSDYTISNFAFIVESTKTPGTPMIYPLTSDAIHTARQGGEHTRGWVEALRLCEDWMDVNFSLEEKFQPTNGVVFINENYNYQQRF